MHSSHSITADLPLVETAQGAVFCGADGVVLTGSHTGQAASPEQLNGASCSTVTLFQCSLPSAELRDALPDVPVWIGSGVTAENVHHYRRAQVILLCTIDSFTFDLQALIIGSELKVDGQWQKHIDEARLTRMIDAWRSVNNNR